MLSRQCLSAGAANSRAATHSCGRAPLVPIAPLGRATPSAAPSRPCVNADEVPQRAALQVVAAGKKGAGTARIPAAPGLEHTSITASAPTSSALLHWLTLQARARLARALEHLRRSTLQLTLHCPAPAAQGRHTRCGLLLCRSYHAPDDAQAALTALDRHQGQLTVF